MDLNFKIKPKILKYVVAPVIGIFLLVIGGLIYLTLDEKVSTKDIEDVLLKRKALIIIDGFHTPEKKLYFNDFFHSRLISHDNHSVWCKVGDISKKSCIKITTNNLDKNSLTFTAISPGKYTLSECTIDYANNCLRNKNLDSTFYFDAFAGEVVYLGKITLYFGKKILVHELLSVEDEFEKISNFIHLRYPSIHPRIINRKIYVN